VPGILSPDQLGVLLGVLQEVGIGVSGFVDSAVAAVSTAAIAPPAAVSTQTSPEPCYYLDVMMQRTVVTALEVNAEVRKTSSQELPDCGLSRLLDGWINVIADRFVRETRFDPLHSAATEQQLFDQVYRWIDDGGSQSDLVLEIVHGDHTRRVELGRGLLEDKGEQRFRQLSDALPRAARVFVSARSMRLPGLLRALDDLHVKAQPLPADALPRGCVLNLALIVPENRELRLVTRLPHSGPAAEIDPSADSVTAARPAATETPADADETADPAATHALLGGEAWPLDARELALPIRQQNGRVLLLAEPGLRLNGDDLADARALLPGDRVSRGEAEYLIIHVRSRD